MNLIILEPQDYISECTYRLTDDRANHIRSVLRSHHMDILEVGLLNGPIGSGNIVSIDKSAVVLECSFERESSKPDIDIDLIIALPRPQTLKKVLATAASMGVRKIHLIRANRVEKSYFHSPLLKPEKYRKYLIEGLSQGRYTRLPEVTIHHFFKPFFEEYFQEIEAQEHHSAFKLLPHPHTGTNLNTIITKSVKRAIFAIGPEGGWIPYEIELMQSLGFVPFELGPWILRVENAVTACIAQLELVKR